MEKTVAQEGDQVKVGIEFRRKQAELEPLVEILGDDLRIVAGLLQADQ
jgi:hypothetical protein